MASWLAITVGFELCVKMATPSGSATRTQATRKAAALSPSARHWIAES